VRKKSTAIHAFYETLGVLSRPAIWFPLVLYLGIKIGIIVLYRMTFLGPLHVMWEFFMPDDIRATVGHYPFDLIHMSALLDRFGLLVGVLVGVIFEGATIVLFANAFREKSLSLQQAFRIAQHRYRALVGVALVTTLALLALTELPAYVLGFTSILVSPKVLTFAGGVGGILVRTLFLYTMPLVLLTDRSVFPAVAESFRWAARSFPQTLLLVLVPFLITVPTMIMGFQSATLIAQVEPEVMIPLRVMTEIAAWMSTLLMIGGLTVWFIRRRGRELVI
jgi:hypothetical protein